MYKIIMHDRIVHDIMVTLSKIAQTAFLTPLLSSNFFFLSRLDLLEQLLLYSATSDRRLNSNSASALGALVITMVMGTGRTPPFSLMS